MRFKISRPKFAPLLGGAMLSALALHSTASAGAYDSWNYHAPISLNTSSTGASVNSNTLKFPVLVKLDNTNFNFALAQPTGQDIRFSKINGTALPYEIESWDATNKSAAVWVLLDTVYGNRTTQQFTMHWGNSIASSLSSSTAVFNTSNGFVGIYHLKNANDATANANNGVKGSDGLNWASLPQAPRDTTGLIGHGQSFFAQTIQDGIYKINHKTFIDVPASASIKSLGNTFTVSAWVKWTDPNYAPGFSRILSRKMWWDYQDGWDVSLLGTNQTELLSSNNQPKQPVTLPAGGAWSNQWHHVAYVFSNTSAKPYGDGIAAQVQSIVPAINSLDTRLTIGAPASHGQESFHGIMDEVRIEKGARSADWIKLCVANQGGEQTLLSMGSIQITDLNNNNIPDVVETVVGQNPVDIGIPSTWVTPSSDGTQAITYSYEAIPGFERCTDVQVQLPVGSMSNGLVPIVQVFTANEAGQPLSEDPSLVLGNHVFTITGAIASEIAFAIPVPVNLQGIPMPYIRPIYFDEDLNQWKLASTEGAYVTGDALHFKTTHFSTWSFAVTKVIVKVDDGFGSNELRTTPTSDDNVLVYNKLDDALNAAGVLAEQGTVVVLVGAGTYIAGTGAEPSGFIKPDAVDLIGGFDNLFSVPSNKIVTSRPLDNATVCKIVLGLINPYYGRFEPQGFPIFRGNGLFDGLRIEGGDHGGMEGDIVRNCQFINNRGGYGAVNANTVEGCIFIGNLNAEGFQGGGYFENRPSVGHGSAINGYQGRVTFGFGFNHASKISSCLFINNAGPVISYGFDRGNAHKLDATITNCTFYRNTGTSQPEKFYHLYSEGGPSVGSPITIEYPYWSYLVPLGDPDFAKSSIYVSNCIFSDINPTAFASVVKGNVSNSLLNTSQTDLDTYTQYNSNHQCKIGDPLFIEPKMSINSSSDLEGFNLQLNSPCRNTGSNANAAERDLLGRLRRPSTAGGATGEAKDVVDMGAMEKYVKVMCVGDVNTEGYAGISYRPTLKSEALKDGYLVDFVGSAQASDENALGEDPSNPGKNPTLSTYAPYNLDKQFEGSSASTITSFSTTINSQITNHKPDYALFMLGLQDLIKTTAIVANVKSELNVLSTTVASSGNSFVKSLFGNVPQIGIIGRAKTNIELFAQDFETGWTVKPATVDLFSPLLQYNATATTKTFVNNYFHNAAGYEIIGKTWYQALKAELTK